MITYKSGIECRAVNNDSIHTVGAEELAEVYDALKDRIKITREEFINGNTREINQIKISSINLYVVGLNLLYNDNSYRKKKFEENLNKRYGFIRFNNRSKAALYVAERLEELEKISPTRVISYNDLRSYALKDYKVVKKEYELFEKRMAAKIKIMNAQDYDRYLRGVVDCSREEYSLQSTDVAKRMKEGLETAKSACKFIKTYMDTKNDETKKKLVSEFGEIYDEDIAIRRLFSYFRDVDKLNSMGYERINGNDYRDLVSYILVKNRFSELVRINDKQIERQIPEVYNGIRINPKYKSKFGDILGNFDNMSIDLMLEIYHTLQEVNDMNSYKGINIDPVKYMYLSQEEKEKMREKVLFQLRTRFTHMSDKELEAFLLEKTNLSLLDEDERKDYLSRARNIVINSIDITAELVNNEELIYAIEMMLGRKTPTAVFEFVNNAQVSRYMYRKMYNADLNLKDINNLLYTQRIAAEYSIYSDNKKQQAILAQMKATNRTLAEMINEQTRDYAAKTAREFNNMMFDRNKDEIMQATYKYLVNKYPDKRPEDLYVSLRDFMREFINSRKHDFDIFDELTPEKIDSIINSSEVEFMFDVVKPDEDSTGTVKK